MSQHASKVAAKTGTGENAEEKAERQASQEAKPAKKADQAKKKEPASERPVVRPPWSPLMLAVASLVFTAGFSSLWGGAMAALNHRRLGDRHPGESWRAWLPLILGAVGLTGAIVSYYFITEAPWWTPPFMRIWLLVKYQLYNKPLWWIGPGIELAAWAAIAVVEFLPQQFSYKVHRSKRGRRASLAVPLLIGLIASFAAVNLGLYGQQWTRGRLASSKYQEGLEDVADQRYIDALGAFSQAIELDPKNADAHLHRARLLIRLRKPDDALKSYDEALKIRPGDVIALLERARLQIAMHKYAEAADDCTRVLDQRPDEVLPHFMRAVARNEMQQYGQALDDMNDALKKTQSDKTMDAAGRAPMYAYRGKINLKLKRAKEAVEDFTKAMQGEPNDPDHCFNRAVAYLELKKVAAAIADFSTALDLNKIDIGSRLARARAYLDTGELQKAIDDCDKALDIVAQYSSEPVEQRSDLAGIYSLRARCRIRQGELEAGLKDAERSTNALDDTWADGYFARGLVALAWAEGYNARGKADAASREYLQAESAFNKAVEHSFKNSGVHARALFYRARVREGIGSIEAAQSDRAEALKLDPDVGDVPALPDRSLVLKSLPQTPAAPATSGTAPAPDKSPVPAAPEASPPAEKSQTPSGEAK